MSSERPRYRFTWIHAIVAVAVVLGIIAIGFAIAPYFSRARLESLLRDAGVWGPLVLLGLQVAQILIAPIPGVFMPILAGVLYGPVLGVAIAAAGTLLGSAIAYGIGSRAGMPLLKRLLGADAVARARAMVGGRRWLALVPLFLLPFTPADAICFISGMIGVPPSRFFIAVLLGRLPKDSALALAGAGLIKLGGLVAGNG